MASVHQTGRQVIGFDVAGRCEGWVSVTEKRFAGGADPTGVADSTDAFLEALDVASSGSETNGRVVVPRGKFLISDRLDVVNGRSLRISGSGHKASILAWKGAAGGSVLKLTNCNRCALENFQIEARDAQPENLIEFEGADNHPDFNAANHSTQNTVRNVRLLFGEHAIRWRLASGATDAMNDLTRLTNVSAEVQSGASYRIYGVNSKVHEFISCTSVNSPIAVQVDNTGAGGGSFSWTGGYVYNTDINFEILGLSVDGTIIRGVNSEGSPRFLRVQNNLSAHHTLVEGVRYAAENINADGYAIDFQAGGPLVVIGSLFGETLNPLNPVVPRFFIQPAGVGAAVIVGNKFDTPGSADVDLVSAGAGLRLFQHGNIFRSADGSTRSIPVGVEAPTTAGLATLTYSATMALDANRYRNFKVVANDSNAFTFSTPTGGAQGQEISIEIKATAALSATDPFPAGNFFRKAAWTQPANGTGRTITFRKDGVTWREISRSSADVPN